MNEEQLKLRLNSGRLSKVRIDALVKELLELPKLVGPLLNEVFIQDKVNEFNASWVFDHLMRKNLKLILPHVDLFVKELKHLKSESCMRPMAHTCQLLVQAYFLKKLPEFTERITDKDLEALVTINYDWLIGEHKVATKVFAMTSLFHLGKQFSWVHPELRITLEQHFREGTSGYQNRAKKTLLALKTGKSNI